jgi:predicted translin family RNA/ssDNA-binding protein
MSHENKGYWDQITKLTAERNELATLLERVLFAWSMGRTLSEENELYVEAADYLKGLRDE